MLLEKARCKALNDTNARVVEPRLTQEELQLRRDRMDIWNNRKKIINKKRPRPQQQQQQQTDQQIQLQVAAPAQEVHPMINMVEVIEIEDDDRPRSGEDGEGVQYGIQII